MKDLSINLDDMSDSELQAFYDEKRALVGKPENTRDQSKQRSYAMLQLKARKARLAGNIRDAMNYEERMGKVYAEMSEYLRW